MYEAGAKVFLPHGLENVSALAVKLGRKAALKGL